MPIQHIKVVGYSEIHQIVPDFISWQYFLCKHFCYVYVQWWLIPYLYGFCNPVRIHGMRINIWYDPRVKPRGMLHSLVCTPYHFSLLGMRIWPSPSEQDLCHCNESSSIGRQVVPPPSPRRTCVSTTEETVSTRSVSVLTSLAISWLSKNLFAAKYHAISKYNN